MQKIDEWNSVESLPGDEKIVAEIISDLETKVGEDIESEGLLKDVNALKKSINGDSDNNVVGLNEKVTQLESDLNEPSEGLKAKVTKLDSCIVTKTVPKDLEEIRTNGIVSFMESKIQSMIDNTLRPVTSDEGNKVDVDTQQEKLSNLHNKKS